MFLTLKIKLEGSNSNYSQQVLIHLVYYNYATINYINGTEPPVKYFGLVFNFLIYIFLKLHQYY